jgi:hypothetical protein
MSLPTATSTSKIKSDDLVRRSRRYNLPYKVFYNPDTLQCCFLNRNYHPLGQLTNSGSDSPIGLTKSMYFYDDGTSPLTQDKKLYTLYKQRVLDFLAQGYKQVYLSETSRIDIKTELDVLDNYVSIQFF